MAAAVVSGATTDDVLRTSSPVVADVDERSTSCCLSTAWCKKNEPLTPRVKKLPNISYGSAATSIRCGAIFSDDFTKNLQLSLKGHGRIMNTFIRQKTDRKDTNKRKTGTRKTYNKNRYTRTITDSHC